MIRATRNVCALRGGGTRVIKVREQLAFILAVWPSSLFKSSLQGKTHSERLLRWARQGVKPGRRLFLSTLQGNKYGGRLPLSKLQGNKHGGRLLMSKIQGNKHLYRWLFFLGRFPRLCIFRDRQRSTTAPRSLRSTTVPPSLSRAVTHFNLCRSETCCCPAEVTTIDILNRGFLASQGRLCSTLVVVTWVFAGGP